MKKLVLLFLTLSIIACSTKDRPQYRVISFNGNNATTGISEGDTIGSKSVKLTLKTSESMLLSDIAGDLVYRITGPQVLDLKEIEKGELETFNAKYFSLITSNLKKSSSEIRHAVLGGVSRGAGMDINYIEKERVLAPTLKPQLTSHGEEECDLTLTIDDQDVEGYNYSEDNVIQLKDIRQPREDVEIILSGECGHHRLERCVVVVSENGIREVLKEEARMKAGKYPKEALLNYYLENKLFDRARRLGSEMENPSPAVRQVMEIIEL